MRPERYLTEQEALDEEAVLRGDRQAFEQLVRQESPRLFRILVRILHDEDEAQSVMQETFLQAFKRLPTFRGESKLTTWLYAIGINLARAALRKARRLQPLDEEGIERLQPRFVAGMHADAYEAWSPLRLAERAERRALVHAAIERLPDDYRTVVTLRDIEGLSTAETARILDISEGAARVRLHRARQALRKMLDGYFR